MFCRQGHPLKEEIVEETGRRCDWCHYQVVIDAKVWACAGCDVDACASCYSLHAERPRSARRAERPATPNGPEPPADRQSQRRPSPVSEAATEAEEDEELAEIDRERQEEEQQEEEEQEEEDEADEEDSDGHGCEGSWDNVTDPDELRAEIYRLQVSLRQSKNASRGRPSTPHAPCASSDAQRAARAAARAAGGGDVRKQQKEARRVQKNTAEVMTTLKKRPDIAPKILAKAICELKEEDLLKLCEEPIIQCIRFGAKREAVQKLQSEVYTPMNTLDIRLNEKISTGGLKNIRKRLSETVKPDGTTERLVLARAPDYRTEKEGGPTGVHVNPIKQWHVRALCGREHAELRAPFVVADHKQTRQALIKLKDGRTLLATVPTEDGFECCGWDILTSARDVLEACEKSNNLRELGEGMTRRLQLIFDAHGWTNDQGITRWIVRCCDTVRLHNNPRFARQTITAVQQDKTKWLRGAAEMGGELSMSARLKAGAKLTRREVQDIHEADEDLMKAQSLDYRALQSTKELLSNHIETFLQVPRSDEEDDEVCSLVSGGDAAAAHAWGGLDSPVCQHGCCFRGLCPKGKWFDEDFGKKGIKRNWFFAVAASHRCPYKILGIPRPAGFVLRCPHCAVEITDELEKKEAAELAAMSDDQRTEWRRKRSKTHAGQLEVPVFVMDHKKRAPSALHIRTNCGSYNVTCTFMRLPFNKAQRIAANELLASKGVLFRFPLKAKSRTPKMVGNDARAIDSMDPEIQQGLFEIFFPDAPPESGELQAAAEQLRQADEALQKPRGARGKSKAAGKKRARHDDDDDDDIVGPGGVQATAQEVAEYAVRRTAEATGEAAKDATTEAEQPEFELEEGQTEEVLLLDEDETLGAETARQVFITHMRFQAALHSSAYDDEVPAQRKAYADAAWAAGKEYVKAINKAAGCECTWQYLHYIFMHLHDDAMEFGLFDTHDDSILEHGNRSQSKNFKSIIWHTKNLDPGTTWKQERRKLKEGRTGDSPDDFEVCIVERPANPNTAVQLHEAVWAAQTLELRRTPEEGGGPSAVREETARVKKEERAGKRQKTEQQLVGATAP